MLPVPRPPKNKRRKWFAASPPSVRKGFAFPQAFTNLEAPPPRSIKGAASTNKVLTERQSLSARTAPQAQRCQNLFLVNLAGLDVSHHDCDNKRNAGDGGE